MLELEDAPRTGGAGFMPLPTVTAGEVESVLRLAIRTDERGNDIEAWAENLDESDLFACMDSQMKAAVLYAAMTTNSVYMSRVQEYIRFKIADELEGS
ncbi:hypothetical protein RE432_18450 [Pusillimonas sp. SM2304]|uniref:hypothetical protein n=1 Tax=Pusillimonas sp. SM2304 TaxID=3073241 RepID=UPI00287494AE|nr:hypothetical protein [Pusillimonas sp. SM2304]MDS1142419.1 hypothetical protein [Pusillimonas sp. SM2304]